MTYTTATQITASSSFDADAYMPRMIEFSWDQFGTNAIARTGWATLHTGSDPNVMLTIGAAPSVGNGQQIGPVAQNDSIEWDIPMSAGTWSLGIMVATYIDCGIITVTLNGVSAGTIDTYTGGAVYNSQLTLAGIAVATSGLKRVKFQNATKNASSSGFLVRGQTAVPLRLLRTA